MLSNVFVGVMASIAVTAFTVAQDMALKSLPILRRAWIFKGHRLFSVCYADAHAIVVNPNGTLNPNIPIRYIKPPLQGMPLMPSLFTISRPVPNSEVRAFKHVVKGFPEIDWDFVADTVAIPPKAAFLAFGSELSNIRTDEVMVALGFPSVRNQSQHSDLAYSRLVAAFQQAAPGFEYGVIASAKIGGSLGIACWGLGEIGTAGAACFLSYQHSELASAMNREFDSNFLALLKFPTGLENDGQLVRLYRPSDIHSFPPSL